MVGNVMSGCDAVPIDRFRCSIALGVKMSSSDEGVMERLYEEISFLEQELDGRTGLIDEISDRVDDLLAEYKFMELEEALAELSGILGPEEKKSVESLAMLQSIANGDVSVKRADSPAAPVVPTMDQLPAKAKYLASEDEDEDGHFDPWSDPITESLRARVQFCVEHIRALLECLREGWEVVVAAAHAGDAVSGIREFRTLEKVSDSLPAAYQLWQACLSELYMEDSNSLGDVGIAISEFERYLATRPATG